MTTPSTAASKDAGTRVEPVIEKGATGPSATHAVVKGEVAPRLPHERDESSDSAQNQPQDATNKAAQDAVKGHVDVPRGPATQQHYSDLAKRASEDAVQPGKD